MPVRGLLALREPRLPGHRGIDLLHQKGVAGIVGAHLDVLDVRLAETGLLEQDVQKNCDTVRSANATVLPLRSAIDWMSLLATMPSAPSDSVRVNTQA